MNEIQMVPIDMIFHRKKNLGFTLVELVVAMVILIIPLLVLGSLMAFGQQRWVDIYRSANAAIQQDALVTRTTFSNLGRKANRVDYTLYTWSNNQYAEAVPQSGQTIAVGKAVEFRYWDTDSPQASYIDVRNTGTHYAFLYQDGTRLKADYGLVDAARVGAVSGGSRRTPVRTDILANHVTSLEFSHSIVSGNIGQGSVRIQMVLTDPASGETEQVKTAVLLRNIWPR